MREYRFEFADSLAKGICLENPESVQAKGFLVLQNMKPWAGALVYVDRPTCIQVSTQSQAFAIGQFQFVCSEEKVYRVDAGALVEVATLLSGHNHRWSHADFGLFGILSDGSNYLYVDADGSVSTVKPFDAQMPKSISLCGVNGQVILGGLLGDWNNLGEEYIAWSKIGSVDFEIDETNEAGFYYPAIGKIKSVQPIGRSFVAFGDKGVALFTPEEQTFGYQKLSSIGISGEGYATATDDEVLYIDKRGLLCRIGTTDAIKRSSHSVTAIGYSWLFSEKSCKMHWDKASGEVKIVVDDQKTYILNSFGMYESDLVIQGSVQVDSGDTLCAVSGSTQIGDAIFETVYTDADVSGLKSISEVYVADSNPNQKFLSIGSRINKNLVYSRERLMGPNNLGIPNVCGEALKIRYRAPDFVSGSQISDIKVQTTKTDRRFGKGYMPQQLPTGD